ncbi:MAG: phosphotransferase family protein [Vicinamibacterales bacterium]
MSRTLEESIRARLATHGFAIRRAVRLSDRGSSPVFRVETMSGRTFKLRTFASASAAHAVFQPLAAAEDGVLPRPLARFGRVLLTEFVDGPTVAHLWPRATAWDRRALLRATARLAQRLHELPAAGAPVRPVSAYPRIIARAARALLRRAFLDLETSRRLIAFEAPVGTRSALTHADICPDNLIQQSPGCLRLIDEERLAVRPIAFDLARAVARWPLEPASEREFLNTYRAAGGDVAGFRDDRHFWLAAAFSTSVLYRLRRGDTRVRPLAEQLEQLRK